MSFIRVYKDFLYVIEELILIFAEIYNVIIDIIASTTNYKAQLFIVIEKFRHNIHLKKTKKEKAFIFKSAFAADKNNKKATN